jgi:hypothetical protein
MVLGGFVDMRKTPEGMEAVALRDSHGRKCWYINAAAIHGILGRNFNQWLQTGAPLNDPEHPKNSFTKIMTAMNWKNNSNDVSPPIAAQATQGQQQLHSSRAQPYV